MESIRDAVVPLRLLTGHRVFEGDNVRILRSDSGDNSGELPAPPAPAPAPARRRQRAFVDGFLPEKHRKPGILHWQKPDKNVQEVVEIAWVSL